jgi:hypothetical protein
MNNINILCIINDILAKKETQVCILLIPPVFDKTNINTFIDSNITYFSSKIKFTNKNGKQKEKEIIYFYKSNTTLIKKLIQQSRLIHRYKLTRF